MIIDSLFIGTEGSLPNRWPFDLPCVRAIADHGLEFRSPVTFFVGENGSGKSTIVEAIAEAYGIDVRGGHGNRKYSSALGPGPLGEVLQLRRTTPTASKRRSAGFFLRAETAFEMLNAMSDNKVPGYGDRHSATVSHGEGYLQVLLGRFRAKGLYLLDEAETPLSFQSCLALMRVLKETVDLGSQVICATHSPLLAAFPGAEIVEFDDQGMRRVEWEQLRMVEHWRRYLQGPDIYLRYLLDDETAP